MTTRAFKVHVSKDYLKFNAAHFIAYHGFREALHGHNYRVSVDVEGDLGADGYVLDFGVVKDVARRVCKRLDDGRCAVTFMAPGREGSGASHVVPVRVRDGTETLMTAAEAWRRKPNRAQLSYVAACLLGGAHGVAVTDVLGSVSEDPALAERTRELVLAEQPQELTRFLETTGLDHSAYWNAFGPPNQSVRRSGLEAFLAAGPEATRAASRG